MSADRYDGHGLHHPHHGRPQTRHLAPEGRRREKNRPLNQGDRSYRPDYSTERAPDMFHFRGQASRDAGDSGTSFNFSRPGPRFERATRNGEQASLRRSPPRGPRRVQPPRAARNHKRDGGRFRGGFQNRGASQRTILRSRREMTPERLDGMREGMASFKALEDLSDSEAEMDLSEDDVDQADGSHGSADDADRPSKRARTSDPRPEREVPKWSNPDPYTSLPPPDETQAKKKDVVKLIRKAKVVPQDDDPSQDSTANAADFISFDFLDKPVGLEDSRTSSPLSSSPSEASASTRTNRKFSHLDNLHPNRASNAHADRVEPPTQANQSVRDLPRRKDFDPDPEPPLPVLDTWPPRNVEAAIAGSKRRSAFVNDEEGTPNALKGKKRKRAGLDGSVVSGWARLDGIQCTPWCRRDTDHSSDPVGVWLHKEIIDFYDFVRPYEFEAFMRNDLIARIQRALRGQHARGTVYSFGSFAAGIYLPTADLDLVFVSDQFRNQNTPVFGLNKGFMWRTLALLKREGVAKPDSQVIWGAKVPLVKIEDPATNLRVDLSFENMTGVTANQTFHDWKHEFPEMPAIVTLIKHFLLMRGLNEVYSGGIGGFTVTCLVTSLLQHMPSVESGGADPAQRMADVLLHFFDFYGNKFKYETTGISMIPPEYHEKPLDAKRDRLRIIDPNRPENDISGGSSKIALVFDTFRVAHKMLQQRMVFLEKLGTAERRNHSILETILEGNYTSFQSQRDRLKWLADR